MINYELSATYTSAPDMYTVYAYQMVETSRDIGGIYYNNVKYAELQIPEPYTKFPLIVADILTEGTSTIDLNDGRRMTFMTYADEDICSVVETRDGKTRLLCELPLKRFMCIVSCFYYCEINCDCDFDA